MTVFIAGGGTGGHIYPALSMAEALKARIDDVQIYFAGSPSGLETTLVPQAGYPLFQIPIGRLNSGKWEKIKTLLLLPWAFLYCFFLLIKHRPRFVIGVGGYASAPMVFVASLIGVPTYIWEPNAHPGLANRWLAPFVRKAFVVFEKAKILLKAKATVLCGMPVRSDFEVCHNQPLKDLSVIKNVLIFGGSQGARGINQVASELFASKPERLNGLKVVHQTGKFDFDWVKERYESSSTDVDAFAFLNDMPDRLKWADIVICRSGASTIAELMSLGKTGILVPYPYASDDHQKANAQSLVDQDAVVMVEQKDLDIARLESELLALIESPKRVQEMSQKMHSLFRGQSGPQIVDAILSELGAGKAPNKVVDTAKDL